MPDRVQELKTKLAANELELDMRVGQKAMSQLAREWSGGVKYMYNTDDNIANTFVNIVLTNAPLMEQAMDHALIKDNIIYVSAYWEDGDMRDECLYRIWECIRYDPVIMKNVMEWNGKAGYIHTKITGISDFPGFPASEA